MIDLKTPQEAHNWRFKQGSAKIGFVPTMGALHEGHAELLRRLRPRCEKLVLSIFVNPTQFGPNEDFSRYPTHQPQVLEADLQLARELKVDAVYLPTPGVMYPPEASTWVEETRVSQPLCGPLRPGHFRGVTTVVSKLLNAVQPHIAYFGLKDAQQFFVLERMARDLDLSVSIEGVATVREPDGLAMSSRNRYLSEMDREKAPQIFRALTEVEQAVLRGEQPASVCDRARHALSASGFEVQYLECLELPNLLPSQNPSDAPLLIAAAAKLGSTRLIDNVILRPEKLAPLNIRVHL